MLNKVSKHAAIKQNMEPVLFPTNCAPAGSLCIVTNHPILPSIKIFLTHSMNIVIIYFLLCHLILNLLVVAKLFKIFLNKLFYSYSA